MTGVETVPVAPDEDGLRLDRWFRRHYPDISHGLLEKWLRSGQVRVDGGRAKSGLRLHSGQRIRVPPRPSEPGPRPSAPQPALTQQDAEDLRARVLHADDELIAIDKPAGLAVQGGTGTRRHLDAMLEALRLGGERPRLVHRLDKDTSGVLILARSASAAAFLTQAFRAHRVRKLYWAVVVGNPPHDAGVVDVPLSKRPGRGGEKVEPDAELGKSAVTRYRVVERAGREAAWLALEPLTGRTHQLRVHCAAVGAPILGDGKYGGAAAFLGGGQWSRRRVHLHARALRIPRPSAGAARDIMIEAPLPEELVETWEFLGFSLDAASLRRAEGFEDDRA